jgi:arylsulfatase A-like enzyme
MRILRSISIFVTFALILGLIGLSSIVKSSLSSNNFNFYQPVFAQLPTTGGGGGAANQRPNFLVIVGDDFGYSDIGAAGSEISTPNLDALTKDGKILTNYHTAATCSPARVSLLTGVDYHIGGIGTMFENVAPNQVGKPGYETWINDKVVTVAELLRDAGYHTLLAGKWHLSGQSIHPGTAPFDRGFEKSFTLLGDGANHFNDREYIPGWPVIFQENNKVVPRPGNNTVYSAELYTNKLIDYVNSTYKDGKPLFMYLAYQEAHTPFQAPRDNIMKYYNMYKSMGWDKIREQRFEKQKELGYWSSNTTQPARLPPNVKWDSLSQDQKNYAATVLAVHAAMIEQLDKNVGRMINYLKSIGKYDNTFIMFSTDNSSSEPIEILGFKYASGVDLAKGRAEIHSVNNSLNNLGNANSDFNYGAWGTYTSVSPFSGWKGSQFEGGTRFPLLVKMPNTVSSSSPSTTNTSTSSSKTNLVKSFAFVNDITPTILDLAKVSHPDTYKGRPVHAMMGKSLVPILTGATDKVHSDNEPIAMELFNATSVRMGDWKALIDQASPGKWKLFNVATDIGEDNDLSAQHPDILQKMIAAYQKYSKDVGVIIPKGASFERATKALTPINNSAQVTIILKDMIPGYKGTTLPAQNYTNN